MNQESLNALDELRVATNALLDQQKISASRVVTVNRFSRPVRLLSFDYYGNSTNTDDLIDINDDINISYYEGDVEVLTE